MARRRRSDPGFWDSFNESYNGTRRVLQDVEMGNAASEKPDTINGFTQEQGDQLNAAGASGQYDISYDQGTGDYLVTPKAGGETTRISPVQKSIMYGKTFDKVLSQDEINAEKNNRMADIATRYNDPERAMRLRQSAQQGTLTDLQIKQAKRADQQAAAEEAYKAGLPSLMNGSRFMQIKSANDEAERGYRADLAAYEQKVKDGANPAELGTPPKQPSRINYGIGDSLADHASFLAYKAQHGKLDQQEWVGLAEKMDKVETEGYERALRSAEAGADIGVVAKEFNRSGTLQFDPKSVVSDTTGKTKIRGVDVDTRFITYKDQNGNLKTINVAAELAGIQGTKDILTTQFAIKKDQREGQQLGLQGRQVALAEGKDKRETDKQAAIDKAMGDLAAAEEAKDEKAAKEARLTLARYGIKMDKSAQTTSEFKPNSMGMGGTVAQKNPDGSIDVVPVSPDGKLGKRLHVGTPGSDREGVAAPTTKEEFDKLPSGAIYIDPQDGKRYKKP